MTLLRLGQNKVNEEVGRKDDPMNWTWVFLIWLLHIPLGLIFHFSPVSLATAHGISVLIIGIFISLISREREPISYVAAYIVGSEVLWRMTGASLPWEYSKYALILLFLLSIIRDRHAKFPVLPTLYFLFLVPSTLLTLELLGWTEARGQISFNLSGPLVLMVSAWYFEQTKFPRRKQMLLLVALIAPIVSIATILFYATLTTPIAWINDSNFITSGGFGPNQVSTILGLGALALLLLAITARPKHIVGAGIVGFVLWFLGQGFLTFSRGGVYAAVIAFATSGVFAMLSNGTRRSARLIPLVVVCSIGIYFTLPILDDFTGGALVTRFGDLNLSRRDAIAVDDIEAFLSRPITGVGVGLAREFRQNINESGTAAHTEYTRAIAEHGIMGIISYTVLIVALLIQIKRTPPSAKIIVVAFVIWGMLTLFHAAMRLAAPSFLLAFAFTHFEDNEGL